VEVQAFTWGITQQTELLLSPVLCMCWSGFPSKEESTVAEPKLSVLALAAVFGSASVLCGSASGSYLKIKCGSGFMPWQNRIGICKGICIKI
jgi:hypothetical protein